MDINKKCWFNVGRFYKFLYFHQFYYNTTWTWINNISKLIALYGFLGYRHKRNKRIVSWAKMYTIEFLERFKLGTTNHSWIWLCFKGDEITWWISNKENVSFVHELKTKKLKLWLNRIPKISRKGMWIGETPKIAMDVVEKRTNFF